MNIKEIVEKYLTDNGLDWLCMPDMDCACLVRDLMPCGEIYCQCQAGKLVCGIATNDYHWWDIVPEEK